MTTAGWIFMFTSLAFVYTLAGWSYLRILKAPPPDQDPPSTDPR